MIPRSQAGYREGAFSIRSSWRSSSVAVIFPGISLLSFCSIAMRCASTPGLGTSTTLVRKTPRRSTVIASDVKVIDDAMLPSPRAVAARRMSCLILSELVPAPSIIPPARATTSVRRMRCLGSRESSNSWSP